MKNPNSQRGTNKVKPSTPIRSRQATSSAKTMAKNKVENALEVMPKSVAQDTLTVKEGFLSALSAMRNGDLLVKLLERFSKREKNK